MQVQVCARIIQTSARGSNQLVSSSVEKRTDMKPPDPSLVANIGLPHDGQNMRVDMEPLAAREENEEVTPSMSIAPTGTTKPEAYGAPLERWQSRQWQLIMAKGASVQRYRNAPHAQRPEYSAFIAYRPPSDRLVCRSR